MGGRQAQMNSGTGLKSHPSSSEAITSPKWLTAANDTVVLGLASERSIGARPLLDACVAARGGGSALPGSGLRNLLAWR